MIHTYSISLYKKVEAHAADSNKATSCFLPYLSQENLVAIK